MSLKTALLGFFKNSILKIAEDKAEEFCEKELEAGFNEIHASHPTEYAVGIPGGHLLIKLLKTKFADHPVTLDVINAIDEAIVASATANGIQLEVPAPVASTLDDNGGPGSDVPPVVPTKPE